jgi:PAS domain S-box-containing protein
MKDEAKSTIELLAELEALRRRVAELEARDITERKQVEEVLAQERNLLRTLIDNLPDYIYVKDCESRFRLSNKASFTSLGAESQEELIGRTDFDLFTPDVAQHFFDDEQRLLQTGEAIINQEEIGRDPNWNRRWLLSSKIPLKDHQGKITGLVGISRDITDQKQLQLELARFRAMMDQSGEAIFVVDPPTGNLVDVNETASRLLGYTREELKQLSVVDIVFEENYTLERWHERAGQIKAAQSPLLLERIYRRKDGTIFPVEVMVSHRNFEGQDYILAVARDMSQQARLEAQLRQAQRLEAVGQLAAGVAHNFNNMLTAIMGYVGLTLESLPVHHPATSDLEGIQKTAQRAAKLTQQLLAFTRSQIIQPRLLNLNELVINMNSMLRQLISETIELEIQPALDLGRVKVDPGQFEQVLVNLVVNARDAMPEGGKLTIATANVTLDQPYTSQHANIAPGDYVRLSVADTGSGMTEEVKEHIFEPFFTTKEVGKGTGLGLATCFGIVKQSQGHIVIHSKLHQGSTFEIYLPRAEEVLNVATYPLPL